MDRPFLDLPIQDLERMVKEDLHSRSALARIRDELAFRETKRAGQLRREVEGLLAGEVEPPPRPPAPDRRENQLGLMDDEG